MRSSERTDGPAVDLVQELAEPGIDRACAADDALETGDAEDLTWGIPVKSRIIES